MECTTCLGFSSKMCRKRHIIEMQLSHTFHAILKNNFENNTFRLKNQTFNVNGNGFERKHECRHEFEVI